MTDGTHQLYGAPDGTWMLARMGFPGSIMADLPLVVVLRNPAGMQAYSHAIELQHLGDPSACARILCQHHELGNVADLLRIHPDTLRRVIIGRSQLQMLEPIGWHNLVLAWFALAPASRA